MNCIRFIGIPNSFFNALPFCRRSQVWVYITSQQGVTDTGIHSRGQQSNCLAWVLVGTRDIEITLQIEPEFRLDSKPMPQP